MTRSVLALAALLALAVSSGAALACKDMYNANVGGKQTVASNDDSSQPIYLPSSHKNK
jgi:hypothetical protein